MTGLIARIRALATSAITWLTAASLILTSVLSQVDDQQVAMVGAKVVVWIATAVLVLRRVVELPKGTRGVLVDEMPAKGPGGDG